MAQSFSIPPELHLCAQALAGEEEALTALANSPQHETLIVANRLAPALAIRATELGVESPQTVIWLQHMRSNAVSRMRLENARNQLSDVLETADIPWVPIKGLGLDPRLFDRPEERISTDLDVLVPKSQVTFARDELISQGWRSRETTEQSRRYVTDEGYNWHLSSQDGLSLELHFRLWGGVPEDLAEELFTRTIPEPEFGPTARRLSVPDSYIIAAVHVWQTRPPRYLALWWDLHRIAGIMNDRDVEAVLERTRSNGLDLFVSFSAAIAADLWENATNDLIGSVLAQSLRPAEHAGAGILRKSSPINASLGVFTLSRLLAHRPSRSGWRAIPRQVWAHPGIVETNTPDTWPWLKRRLTHISRKLHLTKMK